MKSLIRVLALLSVVSPFITLQAYGQNQLPYLSNDEYTRKTRPTLTYIDATEIPQANIKQADLIQMVENSVDFATLKQKVNPNLKVVHVGKQIDASEYSKYAAFVVDPTDSALTPWNFYVGLTDNNTKMSLGDLSKESLDALSSTVADASTAEGRLNIQLNMAKVMSMATEPIVLLMNGSAIDRNNGGKTTSNSARAVIVSHRRLEDPIALRQNTNTMLNVFLGYGFEATDKVTYVCTSRGDSGCAITVNPAEGEPYSFNSGPIPSLYTKAKDPANAYPSSESNTELAEAGIETTGDVIEKISNSDDIKYIHDHINKYLQVSAVKKVEDQFYVFLTEFYNVRSTTKIHDNVENSWRYDCPGSEDSYGNLFMRILVMQKGTEGNFKLSSEDKAALEAFVAAHPTIDRASTILRDPTDEGYKELAKIISDNFSDMRQVKYADDDDYSLTGLFYHSKSKKPVKLYFGSGFTEFDSIDLLDDNGTKKVTITRNGDKTLYRVTVNADGTFSTTPKLPPIKATYVYKDDRCKELASSSLSSMLMTYTMMVTYDMDGRIGTVKKGAGFAENDSLSIPAVSQEYVKFFVSLNSNTYTLKVDRYNKDGVYTFTSDSPLCDSATVPADNAVTGSTTTVSTSNTSTTNNTTNISSTITPIENGTITVVYKENDKLDPDHSLLVSYKKSKIVSATGIGSESSDMLTPQKGTNIILAKRTDGNYAFTINSADGSFSSNPSLYKPVQSSVTTPEKQQTTTSSTGNTVVGTNNTTSTSNTTQQTATTSTNNMVTTNNTTTTTTTPVKEVKKLTSLFSPNKTHSITVRFNEGGKIDSADDVTMGQGYSGTEKVTKISDDGKGFTFTTAAGVAYIVSGLDAAGSSYQTTKVVSTVTNTTTTNTTKDTTTTELFSPNKTHSIKVELDKAGKIVSAALSQGYKTTDKVKNISSDGKSFVFTNTAGADYTITPNLATSTYDTMKN